MLELPFLSIESTIFQCPLNFSDSLLERNPLSFFSIKVSEMEFEGIKLKCLNIKDETSQINLEISKGEKRILELVNACVSHEMRNPINAILAANLKL